MNIPLKISRYYLAGYLLSPALVLAVGISTDGSLGQATTLSTTAPGTIIVPQSLGRISADGNSLFHSFQEFNVHLNQTVLLDGASTLQRIIMRVTGTNPSELSGHLGLTVSNGASNVYLINPNGVTVNANAVIDMPAVFHYSNLPIIQFADGSFFSAVDTKASTLSSAPINAFGFVQPVGVTAVVSSSSLSIPYDGSTNLVGTSVTGLPYYIKRILPANTVLPTTPVVQTTPTTPITPTVTQPTIVAPTTTTPVAVQPIPATAPTTTPTPTQPVSVIPSPPTTSTALPPTTAVTTAQPVTVIPSALPSSTGTTTANPLSPLTALVSTAATIIQAPAIQIPAYNGVTPAVVTGATNSVADKISQAIQRTKLITSETTDQPVLSGFIANNQISPVIVNQDSFAKQSPLLSVNGLLKSTPVFSANLLLKPDNLVKTETWVTQEVKLATKSVTVKQTAAGNNTKSNPVTGLAIPVDVTVSAKRLRLESYAPLPCSRANSLTRSGKGGLPTNETRFGFVPPATVATLQSPPAAVSQTGAVIPSTLSQSGASFPCAALSF